MDHRRPGSGRSVMLVPLGRGLADLRASLRVWPLWSLLGWLDIRHRYARSVLGPFWLTISTGVLVATLGVVYGSLFGQELADYLPMVAIGLVLWNMFSAVVNEGSMAYINSASFIRQAQAPRLVWLLQMAWRNVVVFGHNVVIIAVVLALYGVRDWATLPWFVPGFLLYLLNAMWVAVAAGLLSARFRDLPQIVAAVVQVAFYVTPILFHGSMLSARARWIVTFNPLAYLMDLARSPLLGQVPSPSSWAVGVGCAALGWSLALWLTGRYHARIPYWV